MTGPADPAPAPRDPNWVASQSDGCSVSTLERYVDAFTHALTAACYPSDTLARQEAIRFCSAVDIDYIEAVAQVTTNIDAIRVQQGLEPGARTLEDDMDEARWRLADMLRGNVAELRSLGAFTRQGILTTGYPAGPYGLGAIAEDNDDNLEPA